MASSCLHAARARNAKTSHRATPLGKGHVKPITGARWGRVKCGARERLEKQTGAGHRFEQAPTLALSRDGGEERSSQPSTHTGLEEKALQGLWLGREHLGEEIVLQRRLSAREDAYKRLDLSRCSRLPQRHLEQAKSGGPAFQGGMDAACNLRPQRDGKTWAQK